MSVGFKDVYTIEQFLQHPTVLDCLGYIGSIPTMRDEVLGSEEEAKNAVIWQKLNPLLRSQFPKIMDIIDSVDPQGKCLHTALASLGLRLVGNSRELEIIEYSEAIHGRSCPFHSRLNPENSLYTYRWSPQTPSVSRDEAEKEFYKTLTRNHEHAIKRATGFGYFLSLLGEWLGPDNIISDTIQQANPLDVVIAPTGRSPYPYYLDYDAARNPCKVTQKSQARYKVEHGDAQLIVSYVPFRHSYPSPLKELYLYAGLLGETIKLHWYKEIPPQPETPSRVF